MAYECSNTPTFLPNPKTPHRPQRMLYSILLGVCLALAGNTVISIAFVTLKRAHSRAIGGGVYKDPLWWAGMLLMGPGGMCLPDFYMRVLNSHGGR